MEERTRGFALLKPVCDKVVRVPSKENCSELISILQLKQVLSSEVLQELQPYILFPLELHLKSTTTREEARRCIVECVKEVLSVTMVTSIQKLFGLYALIFFQIFDKNAPGLVANVSEELKIAVTQCASTLVKRASAAITNDLYSKINVPKLSQGIFMSIHLVHTEKSRTVQLSAIEYISTLARVHDSAFPQDAVLRHKVADFLMFVLPGIVGGLSKLMTSDEKQGHKVTVAALRAWSRIITVSLEDSDATVADRTLSFSSLYVSPDQHDVKDTKLFTRICQNEDREGMIDYLANQSRTPEWIATTAEKLEILMEKLTLLQNNQHWAVRHELGLACSLLLAKCSHNLKPCAIHLLEILIMLSEDEVGKVASVSQEALKAFSNKCQSDNSKPLLEILEENFFSLVTKIPRILHSTNDSEQLSSLRLLAGYIRMLGPSKLPEVLNSANHLKHLVTSLIYIVELDNAGVSLLEDISLRTLNSSQNTGLVGPWKQFRNFTDRIILCKTEEICKLVGHLGDMAILTDYFIDLYYSDPLHRKEIVLLLNELTCSQQQEITDYDLHIIKNVIDTYIEPSMWYLHLTAGDERGLNVGEAHNNLVLTCLLVEGVGKIALFLGARFDQFLLRTLYMVLERAGSSHGLLATAGMEAAERLAMAGGHSSVTQLVCANVDYFSHHVTMKLRRYEQNVGVLDVLNVVMRHSTVDVLPCLRHIVGDILLQSCDMYQGSSAVAFLRVFHTFVLCIRKWFAQDSAEKFDKRGPPTKAQCRDFDKEIDETVEAQNRLDQFLESGEVNTDHLEEMPLPQEATETEMDDSMYIDEHGMKKKKVPGYISMTVSVLTRCLHFLPSNNVEQKLIVLETLREGIKVLADWEDELLPVVHLIWSPLIGRFKENPLIMKNSFSLLCTMGTASKDFIRSRTLHDVLPSIYQYLEKSAGKSYRKDLGSVYRFSQDYKLQYDLLDGLGLLAVDLSLSATQVEEMMAATMPYLSHFQPEPLQNCCVTLFKHLSTQDRSGVWAKVNGIIQPCIGNRNSEHLHKNAKLILEFCNNDDT